MSSISVTKTTLTFGWDAGAITIATLATDGYYTFSVGQATGIVCGLNASDLTASFQEIQHGFYITPGSYQIIESGVFITSPTPCSATAVFKIERLRGVVTYSVGASVVGVSATPSRGTVFLDCSLYAYGDSILNATFVAEDYNTGTATLLPLKATGTPETGYTLGKAVLKPLTASTTEGDTNRSTLSLKPLAAYAIVDAVVLGRASLLPMTASGATDGLTPDFAIGNVYLDPIQIGGISYTDSANSGALSLSKIKALGLADNAILGRGFLNPLAAYPVVGESTYFYAEWGDFTLSALIQNNAALLEIPAPLLDASGTPLTSSAVLEIPAPTLSAFGGGSALLEIPAPLITATGTTQQIGRFVQELPAITLSAAGEAGIAGGATLELPAISLTAQSGGFASLEILAPQLTATGTTQQLATAALTLPFLELTATGSTQGRVTVSISLSALTAHGGESGIALIEIPALFLNSSGRANTNVVTETTYAVNIKSGAVTTLITGGFDKLVSAHGRLYGLKSGTLTRLDGSVDGTNTTIPATIRFAPQTFGTALLKRIDTIYLSAREYDGVTLDMIIDEAVDRTYQVATDATPQYGSHKIKVNKGDTFHSAGIKLRNRAGGTLDVGGMEIRTSILSRRVK